MTTSTTVGPEKTHAMYFLLVRRYASTGTCVCLRLSEVGVLSKRLNESGQVFGMEASFYLSYTVF